MDPIRPALSSDRVGLSGGDFHREGVATLEVHPQCFRLIHGEQDAAVPFPQLRDPAREVIDVTEGESADSIPSSDLPFPVPYFSHEPEDGVIG